MTQTLQDTFQVVGTNLTTSQLSPTTHTFKISAGTYVSNGASAVTVTDANVTANSVIIITLKTVGGTVGATQTIQTITAGTGFTVVGIASDTSTYNYRILG